MDTKNNNHRNGGILKVGIGGLIIALMFWKLPMVEILTLFMYVVLIPLALLAAMGLISAGTLEAFSNNWNAFVSEISDRTKKFKSDIEAKTYAN